MSERLLILVDALAVLYRSFYAIRELSTADGRPTNALYGFIRKLDQLRATWDPTHLAVVFDGGLPAERLRLLETYKAQRPPMPDALRSQVELAKEYLDKARTAWLLMEAQEADDVIATVSEKAQGEGVAVRIATGDKDMYQLIDDRVTLLPPTAKGKAEFGAQQVLDKTGVAPAQIVEWLALVGDASDNVPGVPGVGPKTAAKLLGAFGSIEVMWERIEEVASPRTREALVANREIVERNLDMVRLNRGLAVPLDWDALCVRPPDRAGLLPMLEDLEFHAMAAELGREQQLDLF
jgi:DNA polymerase I